MVSAQDLTEDEEAEAVDEDVVDDVTADDEDDEAEVEDDENAELVSEWVITSGLEYHQIISTMMWSHSTRP